MAIRNIKLPGLEEAEEIGDSGLSQPFEPIASGFGVVATKNRTWIKLKKKT